MTKKIKHIPFLAMLITLSFCCSLFLGCGGGGGGGKTVESIAVITDPTKKDDYKVGDSFNPAGMVIEVTYSNGTTEEIGPFTNAADYTAAEVSWQPLEFVASGNAVPVTVSFGGKDAEPLTFAVDGVTAESIVVTQGPDQDVFVVGQTFNPEGMIIRVNWVTGGHRDFGEDYGDFGFVFDPLNFVGATPSDTFKVKVTLNADKYVDFDVKVVPVAVDGIAVATPPSRIFYADGNTFDPAGLIIDVLYNFGNPTTIGPFSDLAGYNTAGVTFDKTTITGAVGPTVVVATHQTFPTNVNIQIVIPVTSVSLPNIEMVEWDSHTWGDGNKYHLQRRLVPTFTPSNATIQTGSWSVESGGEFVDVDEDGMVDAIAKGSGTIKFTADCNVNGVNENTSTVNVKATVTLNRVDGLLTTQITTVTDGLAAIRFEFEEASWIYNYRLTDGVRAGTDTAGAEYRWGPRITCPGPTITDYANATSAVPGASGSGDLLGFGQIEAVRDSVLAGTHGFAVGFLTGDSGISYAVITFEINASADTAAAFGLASGSWNGGAALNSNTWRMYINQDDFDGEDIDNFERYRSYIGSGIQPPERNDAYRLDPIGIFDLKSGTNTIVFVNAGSGENPDMDYLEIIPLDASVTLTFENRVLNNTVFFHERSIPDNKDHADWYETTFSTTDPAKYWITDPSSSIADFWGLLR